MTDNEIKKALECCADEMGCAKGCPFFDKKKSKCKVASPYGAFEKLLLDLINRQQEMIDAFIAGQETLQKALAEKIAEIERLNSDLRVWNDIAHRETEYVEIAKAEAIKEFAERLKEKAKPHYFDNYAFAVPVAFIDNLVKEMVGDAE